MAKFTTKELEVIKKLAQEEIPALIKSGCTEQVYNGKRAELNAHIIQLCVGGEIVDLKGKKEGQSTFRFNKALPSKAVVAEVADIVNTYIATVENPYLSSLNAAEGVDDMSIPSGDVYAANVKPLEKAKNKDLKAKILGEGGIAYYQMKLSGLDVITLAGIGEQARKRANWTKTIIIGGSIIVLAGAAFGGYMLYKKHKDNTECECDENVDVDVDIEAVPEVDIDDAPEVELD